MALSPITVNGFASSWGHITVKCDGFSVTGLQELTYGDSLEESRENGLGLSHRPTRRSAGRYTTEEGSLKGFASDIDAIIKMAAAKSFPPGNWGGTELTIVVQFAALPSEPVRTHVLERCRILSVKDSYSEGTEILKGELTFAPMSIIRDGIVGWNTSPQL